MRIEKAIKAYFSEIREIPLISEEEERRLARRIKEGDHKALEKLVNANLLFVVSIAKNYRGLGLSFSDLIGEGNIGLVKAAKKFDETRGYKFITYAAYLIKQQIKAALRQKPRLIRIPDNRVLHLSLVNKTMNSFQQEFRRKPTIEELADILDDDPEEIRITLDLARLEPSIFSLDTPLKRDRRGKYGDREKGSFYDIIEDGSQPHPDNVVWLEELRGKVKESLSKLPPREAKIIKLYFGLGGEKPHTLQQIGDLLDLTREGVRQIIKEKVLKRLKFSLRAFAEDY